MTTLRREATHKAESILIPAYSDNPQTQGAIDYAKAQAIKVVDALIELRGFYFLNSEPVQEKKNLFQIYESNIGALTPMIADRLEDAEKLYAVEWIEDAIKLAVEHNKRNWKYCEAILKRWKEQGKDEGKKQARKTDETPIEYDAHGIIKSW